MPSEFDTEDTAPEGDEVAISLPFGSTARSVPAGVPREVNHTEEVAVSSDVEALVKSCVAVHQFACARFRSAVIVPLVVTGVEPIVSVELVLERPTDETVAFEVLQVEQVMEPPEPTCTNEPPRGDVGVRVDVATPYTPAPPLLTRRLLEEG